MFSPILFILQNLTRMRQKRKDKCRNDLKKISNRSTANLALAAPEFPFLTFPNPTWIWWFLTRVLHQLQGLRVRHTPDTYTTYWFTVNIDYMVVVESHFENHYPNERNSNFCKIFKFFSAPRSFVKFFRSWPWPRYDRKKLRTSHKVNFLKIGKLEIC